MLRSRRGSVTSFEIVYKITIDWINHSFLQSTVYGDPQPFIYINEVSVWVVVNTAEAGRAGREARQIEPYREVLSGSAPSPDPH